MNNNILLDKPAVKFEFHKSMTADFPFVFHPCVTGLKRVFSFHESLELLYFLDGEGYVLYDGTRCPVRKGDIVAVNAYALHQVVSECGHLPHFCVIIARDFCRRNGIDPNQLELQRVIRDDRQATVLLQQVMDTYADPDAPFRNAGIKCAVLELLLFLCRHYSIPRSEAQLAAIPSLEYVRRSAEYMKANLSRKLTCDDIAASAGLSKFHFLREFKRITGCTPIHYLNAIRCEYARNLLESGQCSIKEAAYLSGFTNNSYFSSVFRRYTGLLPSQLPNKPKGRENG